MLSRTSIDVGKSSLGSLLTSTPEHLSATNTNHAPKAGGDSTNPGHLKIMKACFLRARSTTVALASATWTQPQPSRPTLDGTAVCLRCLATRPCPQPACKLRATSSKTRSTVSGPRLASPRCIFLFTTTTAALTTLLPSALRFGRTGYATRCVTLFGRQVLLTCYISIVRSAVSVRTYITCTFVVLVAVVRAVL